MKQKKIGDILYVFDDVPYYIQEDTDAATIYVQEEYLAGYQELNPTLEFTKYNYNLMRITKPEWYDAYMQDDEPEEEGYSPDAVEPVNGDYTVLSFPNGDRGVGLRMTAASPVIEADRQNLEDDFTSIGASDDDLIDDLVGEYDTEAAVEGTDIDLGTIVVKKSAFGRYSFQSQGSEIMSVDYSDTTSYVGTIDTTGLAASLTGDEGIATFSLVNQQPITKEPAGLYFDEVSTTVDIYDGTSYTDISLVQNPNDLPVEYSIDDQDLSLSVESSYITVSDLKEGDFTVTAYTPGNDYYLSGSAYTSLIVTSIVPKADPQISWAQEEYVLNTYGGLSYIDCEYSNPNNITGVFANTWGDGPQPWSVGYGDSSYIRFSYDGTGELSTGKVNLTIGYLGDETYAEAWDASSYITLVNEAPVVYDDYPIQANGDQTQEFSDPTDIRVEDITGLIEENITWTETGEPVEYYPESYVPVPFITIYDGNINDNVKIVDYVSLGTLEDSSSQAYGAVAAAAGSVVLDSSYWTIKVYIPSTDYNGVHYRDKTVTFTDTFNKAYIDYPISIDSSTSIMFDDSDKPTPQDIEDTIMANVHDYDDTWMPPIQVNIYKEDSENPGEMIPISEQGYEMYSNDLETDIQTELDESGTVVPDTTVWYIDLFIPETTYVDEKYAGFGRNVELSFTHVTYNYPVTLLNNDIQFDPDVSDQDVEDAITGNLDGYDSSWMPEPTITVKYGQGDSDYVCQDVLMTNLDFSNDMSSITFGSTVWTVYYTIAADDYAGEHYAQQDLEFTISFVDYAPTYEDYPVTLLSDTAEVEYEEGSSDSNYVTAVADVLMGLLSGYDDTWMPTPTCIIYAPDPQDPNELVTITEATEIGGTDFETDLGAAFQDSGAVVADQTQWHVILTILSSTYGGDEYQNWSSTDITLSFVSPAVEPLGHFRLTSNQNGSTVSFNHGIYAPSVSLEYTTDEGSTWTSWDYSSITLNEGESVCFRGVNSSFMYNGSIPGSNANFNKFTLSGDISASGNIMSLLYGDNFEGQTSTKVAASFANVFVSCTALTDISELELPATTLLEHDYYSMFSGCSNITKAPYLPADTAVSKCYEEMFYSCSKLEYIKFNLSTIDNNATNNWCGGSGVASSGMLINENPNFDSSTFTSVYSGLPSGWTFLTSDPIDYPVNITDEHTYQHGETHQASDIETLIMSCISDYDDTWMPAIQCTITDTPGGAPLVTYTDHTDLGGTQWTSDVSDALTESGAITADETIWTCQLDIPAYTYNGQYYNAWSGVVQISFYSV